MRFASRKNNRLRALPMSAHGSAPWKGTCTSAFSGGVRITQHRKGGRTRHGSGEGGMNRAAACVPVGLWPMARRKAVSSATRLC
eukprot:6734631-Prymnesium_polylepis.1